MKTMIRTLTALALSAGLIGLANAQSPPNRGVYRPAKTAEKIHSMKPGDRYALVCKECGSATVGEIINADDAEKLCHDGGTLHCGSCEKKVTIKRIGPPGKGNVKPEVKYLNSEGEECMVLIPLKN